MLAHKGATVTDPLHIANIFNDYFSSIAEKTKANIKFSNKSFQDFLHHTNEESLFITPADAYEVNLIISSLNSDKSTGPNSLPTKILELLKNEISTHLADIFNLSFSSGVFPSILKIAKVIPLHKKESKLFYPSYRPISLLSNIVKIIEKIMYNRIYKFLDKNNIIYSLQFGFRQHYSTSHALLNLTEAIMKALDDGNFACDIFVDLHKPFDTVNHSILLSKLCHYGICGLTNKWFESYLANRKQFVSVNGFVSSTSSIASSVPQGSVLGLLLFLLYINDLHVAIKHCTVHHLADDTNLFIINKPLKRLNKLLNSDLKNLINWLNANKTSLNFSKTELNVFKTKRKPLDFNMKIKLNGKDYIQLIQ